MSKEDGFDFSKLEEEDGDVQPHLRGHHPPEAASGLGFDDNFNDIKPKRAAEPSVGHSAPQQQQSTNDASNIPNSHTSGSGNREANSTNVQVQYNSAQGNVNVMQTREDGSRYIDTHGIPQRWSELEHQRPLRKRRMQLLKVFSVISCFFFFPSGIAAAYYAFRTETEFNEGIIRGNIDRAQKFAKRSERFIILSFVMSIVMAALVLAVIERPYYTNYEGSGPIVG